MFLSTFWGSSFFFKLLFFKVLRMEAKLLLSSGMELWETCAGAQPSLSVGSSLPDLRDSVFSTSLASLPIQMNIWKMKQQQHCTSWGVLTRCWALGKVLHTLSLFTLPRPQKSGSSRGTQRSPLTSPVLTFITTHPNGHACFIHVDSHVLVEKVIFHKNNRLVFFCICSLGWGRPISQMGI